MPNQIQDNRNVVKMTTHLALLEARRTLCRDLMGGTATMIAAGKTHLPQHPAETDPNYTIRLNQNILTNFLSNAVDKSAGKIFSKPIQYKDDVPLDIVELCKNVDRQGRMLDAFILDRVKKSFVDGISYILVDMPKVDTGVVTVADETNSGRRPYAVGVDAENLLEVKHEIINGKTVLTRVRILEVIQEPNPKDEWSTLDVTQVRVLIRDVVDGKVIIKFEIYQEKEVERKKAWVVVDSGITTFEFIPLIPIYTNRVGYMEGEPVFQSTAELNLEHWRSKSEQLHSMSFGRFAMLAGSGVSPESKVEVGPNKKLFSDDPQSKFYYVESNGVGLEQGWKHLQEIEESIESAAAVLRVEQQGRVSATAAAIDSDETNASLKAVVGGIKDSTEVMLDIFAFLMGKGSDKGGTLVFNTNFGTKKGTDIGLQEVNKLALNNHMSANSAIRNLIWRGELPSDFDFEKNDAELKEYMRAFEEPDNNSE